jgi:exosortase
MGAALAAAFVCLAAAGIYATTVGWAHAMVAFVLTLAGVLALGAGLVALSADEVRVVPFNWTALTTLGLWLLCAPIPPGTYSRLTLSLQLSVSEHVLAALHFVGVAASRNGNIIELANTSVGVEEACSGVRSLISCVFAGGFFAATLVHRAWARALIILLAAPLALVMNFVRSLTLTLLANRGVDISGTWHDATGFAVLGVTAAILGGLALLLERPSHSPPAAPAAPATRSRPVLAYALAASLCGIFAVAGFFAIKTASAERTGHPAPDLLTILPAQADGWRVETDTEIYQFSDQLETEFLAQRTYFRHTDHGEQQVTFYLAYWPAGQSSVSAVAAHTPDACWPGAGWTMAPVDQPRQYLAVGNHVVPPAEARLFRVGDYPQHVWFWHLYDGRPLVHTDPRSWSRLLSLGWQYGFRKDGDQLFVRISSNQPWSALQNEPLLRDIFNRLQPLGL